MEENKFTLFNNFKNLAPKVDAIFGAKQFLVALTQHAQNPTLCSTSLMLLNNIIDDG